MVEELKQVAEILQSVGGDVRQLFMWFFVYKFCTHLIIAGITLTVARLAFILIRMGIQSNSFVLEVAHVLGHESTRWQYDLTQMVDKIKKLQHRE